MSNEKPVPTAEQRLEQARHLLDFCHAYFKHEDGGEHFSDFKDRLAEWVRLNPLSKPPTTVPEGAPVGGTCPQCGYISVSVSFCPSDGTPLGATPVEEQETRPEMMTASLEHMCRTCSGMGEIPNGPCPVCFGTGQKPASPVGALEGAGKERAKPLFSPLGDRSHHYETEQVMEAIGGDTTALHTLHGTARMVSRIRPFPAPPETKEMK